MSDADSFRPRAYSSRDADGQPLPLTGNELDGLVRRLDGLQWAYLEREVGDDCVLLTAVDAATPSAYTTGRAFGPTVEVRWHTVPHNAFSVQILAEQPVYLDGFVEVPRSFDPAPSEPYHILLFGTLARDLKDEHYWGASADRVWIETRIPRPLQYPVDDAYHQVGVLVHDYCMNGMTIATRWLELQGV